MHWSQLYGSRTYALALQIQGGCHPTIQHRMEEHSPREVLVLSGGAENATFPSHHEPIIARYVQSQAFTTCLTRTADSIRRCIPKMDHHCPWTINCVSHRTFPHFFRFLFYAVTAMIYLEYFTFVRIGFIWERRNEASVSPHSMIHAEATES